MVPSNDHNFYLAEASACKKRSERFKWQLDIALLLKGEKKKKLAQNKVKYFPDLHMLQIKNKYQICFLSIFFTILPEK